MGWVVDWVVFAPSPSFSVESQLVSRALCQFVLLLFAICVLFSQIHVWGELLALFAPPVLLAATLMCELHHDVLL
jgi:hypothetical protein